MAYAQHKSGRERALSVTAVIFLHIGVIALLLIGFTVAAPPQLVKDAGLVTITITPPPPPLVEDKIAVTAAPEGAASPANIKSRATTVVQPKPAVVIPSRTKVIAAPEPRDGGDNDSGAADDIGPGSGAGGEGNGTGSGNSGDGTGGGNTILRARKIAGEITQRDYPEGLPRRTGVREQVTAFYIVLPTGRVTNCKVAQSSGNPALDDATCRLIKERFRYTPAHNAAGEAVFDQTGWEQRWCVGRGCL